MDGSSPAPNPIPASAAPRLKALEEHAEPSLAGMPMRDLGTEDKAARRQRPAQDPGPSWPGSTAPPKVSAEPSQAQSCPLPPVLSSMSPLPSPKFTAWAHKVWDASSNPTEIACDPKPRNIALVMKRDEKFRAVINSCKEVVWLPCRLRSGGYLNVTGTWLNCLGSRLFKVQNHTVQFVVLICSC